MNIGISHQGTRVLVSITGDLDFGMRESFEDEMRRLIERSPVIDIDFQEVRFIDSSGVAALITCCEEAGQAGVSVRFLHVPDDLMEIFTLLGVREVLPIA